MDSCNVTKFPMEPKIVITKDEGGSIGNSTEYKCVVGGLRYLVHTCSDISYAVEIISRFMKRPTQMHLNDAKKIIRYIKRTLNYGLTYSRNSADDALTELSYSDLAGYLEDMSLPEAEVCSSLVL